MLAKKALSAAPAAVAQYVEDVFSTYLYTGNGSTQTITNGIDLSGEGGLVWVKNRTTGSTSHGLYDTLRGVEKPLASDTTSAQADNTGADFGVVSFASAGFSIGAFDSGSRFNTASNNYVTWTFRKAEKFFDVVTYTGNGTTKTVSHNLGSTPGCIIVKKTSSASSDGWPVYHRSLGASYRLLLNSTASRSSAQEESWFGDNSTSVSPTSTQFTVGSKTDVNASGETYVAYLFAHNAGGFGDAGDQSVISCGSYTGAYPSNVTVDLGWEPQWLLIKNASRSSNWCLVDTMRGIAVGGSAATLAADSSAAENGVLGNADVADLTATGFIVRSGLTAVNVSGDTHIYIAIRRGPMKTPEAGTEVYTSDYRTGGFVSGFPVDMALMKNLYTPNSADWQTGTRLLGTSKLATTSTAAQTTDSNFTFDNMTGWYTGTPPADYQSWMFRRAPGFFDVVCYTGTGSTTTVSHNLGVAPELMIVKARSATGSGNWPVYSSARGATKYLLLNLADSDATASTIWNDTSPTSSVFSVGTSTAVNGSGGTYVAYLFASVSGVSKVGTYTGNGTSQTINCGFTAGARFVLIKRTDSTGDWVVFDSARGIVSGDDPYLLLNSTAAEVTNKDAVDTDNTGFVVNETTGPNINTNSATYIYLAIA